MRLALLHTCLGKSLWVAMSNYGFYKVWERFAATVGRARCGVTRRLRQALRQGLIYAGNKVERASHDASTLGAVPGVHA